MKRDIRLHPSSALVALFLFFLTGNTLATFDFTAPRAFSGSLLSTAAKFNADDHLDVISALSDRLVLSIAKGDRTFVEPITLFPCSNFASNAFATPMAGDYNGDGKMDIAVLEQDRFCTGTSLREIVVMLGRGDGTFGVPVATLAPTSFQPQIFDVVDMNGDGNADLLMSTGFNISDGDKVGVFLSNGTGGFIDPPVIYNVGGQAFYAHAVGDFTNDDRPDVLVFRRSPADIVLMVNDGSGALGAPQNAATFFVFNGSITAGYFTADSNLDFAVIRDDVTPKKLELWSGTGNGTFTQGSSLNLPAAFGNPLGYRLFARDFTGDGFQDIAIAITGRIFILKGSGSGTFIVDDLHAFGVGWLEPADFDGDGRIDIATNQTLTSSQAVPNGASNEFSILYGLPIGRLQSAPYFQLPFGGDDVAIADLTNDGLVDFAITGNGNLGEFYTLIQSPGKQFSEPKAIQLTARIGGGSISPTTIASADFNADGKLDVVVAGAPSSSSETINVLAAKNEGGANFSLLTEMSLGGRVTKVIATDLNGDGKVDLAFSQSINITTPCAALVVALGNGNGTFATPVEYLPGGSNGVGLATGDLTGDDRPELVLLRANSIVEVFTNNGAGSFTSVGTYPLPGPPDDVELADLNGNGLRDIVVAHSINKVGVLPGTGNATFGPRADYPTTGLLRSQRLVVTDLNGDSRPDVATTNNGVLTTFTTTKAGVLVNRKLWVTSPGLLSINAADINDDDKTDLVTTSAIENFVTIALMVNLSTPELPGLAPFDFDGDNKTDVGIFRPSVGEWWILRSLTGSVFAAQFGASSDKIAPADFTGDGKTDVAFWRPATGEWVILRSEDLTYYSGPFGTAGDIPVPADYDADGKADVAVFRPSSGFWFVQRSSDNATTAQQFGTNGDQPVAGDYDGDGRADVGVFRPGAGEWWISRSTAGVIGYSFGSSLDKTVAGDYTGDGKTDVAFWRPSTGEWVILRSEDTTYYSAPFGLSTDLPSPGDYDGDGKYDLAVYRPAAGTWFVNRTSGGSTAHRFGASTDQPIPGAFVR